MYTRDYLYRCYIYPPNTLHIHTQTSYIRMFSIFPVTVYTIFAIPVYILLQPTTIQFFKSHEFQFKCPKVSRRIVKYKRNNQM